MSNNDAYFNKLKKIKKKVAFESVKKVPDTEKDLQEDLESLESRNEKLTLLCSEKDNEIKALKSQISSLRNNINSISEEKNNLEKTLMEKYRYSSEEKDAAKDSYDKLEIKYTKALETLSFYSEGNHFTSGVLGDKIVDRGEFAAKTLENLK